MSELPESLSTFVEHAATKERLRALVDGLGEDDNAIVIVARADGAVEWITLNLWRWSCIGLLETVRDEMRVIRAARMIDDD